MVVAFTGAGDFLCSCKGDGGCGYQVASPIFSDSWPGHEKQLTHASLFITVSFHTKSLGLDTMTFREL